MNKSEKVIVTTERKRSFELTEEEIGDILIAHFKLSVPNSEVRFDVSSGGFLRGATVEETLTTVDEQQQ